MVCVFVKASRGSRRLPIENVELFGWFTSVHVPFHISSQPWLAQPCPLPQWSLFVLLNPVELPGSGLPLAAYAKVHSLPLPVCVHAVALQTMWIVTRNNKPVVFFSSGQILWWLEPGWLETVGLTVNNLNRLLILHCNVIFAVHQMMSSSWWERQIRKGCYTICRCTTYT